MLMSADNYLNSLTNKNVNKMTDKKRKRIRDWKISGEGDKGVEREREDKEEGHKERN